MELQVPYSVCSEVPTESILWREEGSDRENTETVMRMEGIEIIEAEMCSDHVHMLVSIPPKISVSSFMGYLKGKSSVMLYEQFGEMKYRYQNREFWCRGYYVDTVGRDKVKIANYIKHQFDEDRLGQQLTMLGKEGDSPFKGRK